MSDRRFTTIVLIAGALIVAIIVLLIPGIGGP